MGDLPAGGKGGERGAADIEEGADEGDAGRERAAGADAGEAGAAAGAGEAEQQGFGLIICGVGGEEEGGGVGLAPIGEELVAGGAGGVLEVGAGLWALPVQGGVGDGALGALAGEQFGFGGRAGAEAVIDCECGDAAREGLMGEVKESGRIGAAAGGDRQRAAGGQRAAEGGGDAGGELIGAQQRARPLRVAASAFWAGVRDAP